MDVYLSSLETAYFDYMCDRVDKFSYMLFSFYYLKDDVFRKVAPKCEKIMIDSGAHSFQKGKTVDWVNYTKRYAEWIKANDSDKITGYFEMDVDNMIGYSNVLELRKILESVTNKIIPVWHKNRGIEDFKKMCQDYSGRWIAVTGFKNEDIKDEQYLMFLKYAKKHNCKVHCLGMTRRKILDKIPFDSVDSSSWRQSAIYGRVAGKKVKREFSKSNMGDVFLASLREGMKMQREYKLKWIKHE